jgi:hypothetical protein
MGGLAWHIGGRLLDMGCLGCLRALAPMLVVLFHAMGGIMGGLPTSFRIFPPLSSSIRSPGGSVIGHGLMLLLSIVKWRNLLNSQLPVYDGDRQAPPDLLNLLLEGTDQDPDKWLMRHKSIPAFPCRNASASSNRRSFGSKRYF